MKLISMTEFVLQEKERFLELGKGNYDNSCLVKSYDTVFNYAEFLSQPLTLGMFVPVDEEGRVWEAPKTCCSGRECGCMGQPINYFSREHLDKYYDLEEKVLFEGFVLNGEHLENKELHLKIYIDTFEFIEYHDNGYGGGYIGETVENLSNCNLQVTLTPSALKQIGI